MLDRPDPYPNNFGCWPEADVQTPKDHAILMSMGAWHYQLKLGPKASVGADPDEVDFWTEEHPRAELLAGLRSLLPKNTSSGWPGGAVEEFRTDLEGGSYIRIWHEEHDGPVRSIEFKFSSMGDDRTVLDRLIELSARHDVSFYSSGTSRWFDPTLKDVLIDLRATAMFKVFWERDWVVAPDGSSIEPRVA
jgi:hypothetical protein